MGLAECCLCETILATAKFGAQKREPAALLMQFIPQDYLRVYLRNYLCGSCLRHVVESLLQTCLLVQFILEKSSWGIYFCSWYLRNLLESLLEKLLVQFMFETCSWEFTPDMSTCAVHTLEIYLRNLLLQLILEKSTWEFTWGNPFKIFNFLKKKLVQSWCKVGAVLVQSWRS